MHRRAAYTHDGDWHDYVPDFIVWLTNGVHLILEAKGHDPLKEVKAQSAQRWIDAVNADGIFGTWRYVVAHDMGAIPELLEKVADPTKETATAK